MSTLPAKSPKPPKPPKPLSATKPARRTTTPVANGPPAARATGKAAPKLAPKPPPKPTSKPAATPAADDAAKPARQKAKLVRDSFTMPQADFALIQQLKDRSMGFARNTKKSELLRAGLQALAAMPDARLQTLLDGLPALKAGRPKKSA